MPIRRALDRDPQGASLAQALLCTDLGAEPERIAFWFGKIRQMEATWYHKPHPTLCDAIVLVRKELWVRVTFCDSPREEDTTKVPRALMER